MYIKSMIIEGFKSYGRRVEIHGFDRLFNAITGLNGTGKSNILDAICFVLGITNLSQVRATNLQDLVYKSGQAGVTKASVTIIFDNLDKSQSPYGYEMHDEITITRQVVIGGTNKYLINGSNAQNKRVQDLFGSVQLNVNNPHFLIMQGRITKVLNMKPPEILSMIEEAAGTRMYEAKKKAAEATIQKKDAKLKEIDSVIQDEITPKLNKLKSERQDYNEYSKTLRELEYLNKIYVAYNYVKMLESCKKNESSVEKILANISELHKSILTKKQTIQDIEKTIVDLQKIKDTEDGGKLAALDKQHREKEKQEAKVSAVEKSILESITSHKRELKRLEKELKDDEAAIKSKETELSQFQNKFDALRTAEEKDQEALKAAQQRFQAISSGLFATSDGSEAATFEDQLMSAKQAVTEAESEIKSSQMHLTHYKKELQEKEKQMTKTVKEHQRDQQCLNAKEQEVKKLEAEMKKMNYRDGRLESLNEEKRRLLADIRRLEESIYNFESRNPRLSFRYSDPENNFNRSRVKGLVCRLLTVKNKETSRALEVAAGGRLYNAVVDTEQTSKLILQRGRLERRVTIIPLNKITSSSIEPRVVQYAKQLVGAENVDPALSLINCSEDVQPAMQWVFGQTFICKDMATARQIAFNDRIKRKCVTLEGDVVDPGGTLSGGAVDKTAPVFDQLQNMIAWEAELKEKTQELAKVEQEIATISKVAERYNNLKEKLMFSNQELQIVQQRIEQTEHHQLTQEVAALKDKINDLNSKVEECQKIIKDGTKKVKDIEDKKKNAKQIRDKEMKAAETEMNRLTRKAAESRNAWKQKEAEYQTLNLEINELKESVEKGRTTIAETQKLLAETNEKAEEAKASVEQVKRELKQLSEELKSQKDLINQKITEIKEANETKELLLKEIGDIELSIKKLEGESTRVQNEAAANQEKVAALENKYPWIESDKKYFGQAGSTFDFAGYKAQETEKRINRLEEKKKSLSGKVNSRAGAMLGKEEDQYEELMKKKNIVKKDREKIFDVIKQLDEKKKQALQQACKRVNKDFGEIFASLLPGAKACLQPPPGQQLLDGLEVKVGFGDVWKESLTELSGGQRSLVALSLILAMLMFKPAPIYILDEVDAALDLSHTQNIGVMLKQHFKQSQFIVVSLKDGMFNNANVLFRTKFVDGMSAVTRTVQHMSAVPQQQNLSAARRKR